LREARRIAIPLRMAHGHDNDEVTLERLERALALAAYIVVRYGKVYAPILERLEREVEAARKDDPVVRARKVLESYTDRGGLNAMRLSSSNLLSSE
jgi:hypothetical protein